MREQQLKGLYAITDTALAGGHLIEQVELALQGGARIIQYRDKVSTPEERLKMATLLRERCQNHGALFIINDDLELALRSGAHGIHLGRDDNSPATARERLGSDVIIGLSCYNDLPRALRAQEAGVDYVAFGRFFPSNTKPQAVQAELELLRRARSQIALPIVAIGGITPENGASLIEAGADMLAAIHAVFGQPDIRAACQRFSQLFEQS
jgi:thiamine-phosphate pyrophosphorylase